MDGQKVEVWQSREHYILKKGSHSLWCSRRDGSLLPGRDTNSEDIRQHKLLGNYCGLIGKMSFFNDEHKLLLVKEAKEIGRLPPFDAAVYCIEKISIISLSLETVEDKVESLLLSQSFMPSAKEKEMREKEKLERRFYEALLQMFNGSQSFYYSYDADLTHSLQRHHDSSGTDSLSVWQKVDERFFWNSCMVSELTSGDLFGPEAEHWVLPIVQGYIEIRHVEIPSPDHLGPFTDHSTNTTDTNKNDTSRPVAEPETADSMASLEQETDMTMNSVSDNNTQERLTELYEQCSVPASVGTGVGAGVEEDTEHEMRPGMKEQEDKETDVTIVVDDFDNDEEYPTTPITFETATYEDSPRSIDTDDLANICYEEIPLEPLVVKEEEDNTDQKRLWRDSQVLEERQGKEGLPKVAVAIISRRSRYRAGTRYLRRGVDEQGHVANYVETELVVQVRNHVLSYVLVRGSVPVYWVQPGYKYRPPPVIKNSQEATCEAFERHFETQVNLYRELVIANLVNQSGREKVLSDAFEKHLLLLNCPALTYVAFDFHRYCKGKNNLQNICFFLDHVKDFIGKQKYFWMDLMYSKAALCIQGGVFRVNCIDCLDRTNYVQSVIAKEAVQIALRRLGLLSPFKPLSGQFLRQYQEMWANNGDTISKQYSGTVAMKGDLTRYGERRLYGMMKDGYNSAHRYYQNMFNDAYRQTVMDLMQGKSPVVAFTSLPRKMLGDLEDPLVGTEELPLNWSSDREQTIQEMIQICRHELYPNLDVEVEVQGWALLEAAGYSFIESSDKEEETVLLLCKERRHICVASFNTEFEQVACCIRIPLERVERIAIGPIGTLLRSSRRLYMRVHYSLFPNCSCYFTFRTINSASPEEDRMTLLSIAQRLSALQLNILVTEQKLTKKRSPPHEGIVFLIAPSEWLSDQWELITPRVLNRPDSPNNSSEQSPQHHQDTGTVVAYPRGSVTSTSSDDEAAEKSFSEPSSPVLSRRTSLITLEERSRLCVHSSYNDLASGLAENSDPHPQESSTKRHHLDVIQKLPKSASNIDIATREPAMSPDEGASRQRGYSDPCQEVLGSGKDSPSSHYRERSPLLDNTAMKSIDSNKPQDSEEGTEQEQQPGSIFSRITGRILQKVLPASSESQSSISTVQSDASSVKTVFQAIRTGVASLASSASSAPTLSNLSTPANGGGQPTVIMSEEERRFEQMKRDSQTKFIII